MWVYLFFSRHIGNLQGHFCGIFTREDEILYDIKFSIKWFLIIFIKNIRDFKMIMNNSIAVNFLSIFEWCWDDVGKVPHEFLHWTWYLKRDYWQNIKVVNMSILETTVFFVLDIARLWTCAYAYFHRKKIFTFTGFNVFLPFSITSILKRKSVFVIFLTCILSKKCIIWFQRFLLLMILLWNVYFAIKSSCDS